MVLEPSDPGGLAAFDAAVIDPSSPLYHRFLTEPQYERQYGPSPSAAARIAAYFSGYGARLVGRSADGVALTFRLSSHDLDRALGVTTVAYDAPSGFGFTATGPPRLPAELAALVAGVDGLSGSPHAGLQLAQSQIASGQLSRQVAPRFVHDNQSGSSWYYGSDYAQAYRVTNLFPGTGTVANTTYPTGEAVATILMSGFNQTSGTDLPPFDPGAVAQYFNDSFPTSWPKPIVNGQPVTVSGVTPPMSGTSGNQNDTTLDQSENSLDLEMVGSMAPGATIVNFYFAASLANAASATPGSLADDFGQCLSSALAFNYGPARLAAVTNSYGLADLNDTLWNQELVHAAAIGVTVLAASGDQADAPGAQTGRQQGQWPGWPSTASFTDSGVVSVGGVSLGIGGTPVGSYSGLAFPTGYDSNLTGITSAVAWYETLSANLSGSEGGISNVYPEPSWQFVSAAQPPISQASGAQGVGQLGRAVPDLALPANDTIAYVAASSSTIFFNILEGTSVASPLLAGELASAAAVAGHPFGFLDPELYRIGSYFAAFPSVATPFLDVTVGGNWVFSAGPGWDAVTGWGQLDAPLFLAADANQTIASYRYTGPTPGVPAHTVGSVPVSNLLVGEYLGGALIALGVAVIIVVASRPRAPRASSYPPGAYPGFGYPGYAPPPPGVPPPPPGLGGGYPPGGSPPPGAPAWFACPYCGGPRPAEPTRCPYCGRL